ncbi:MAG TPA: Sec-independent protein translocase subunit TatA [Pseudonocardiaceae bacterium]
MGEFSPWHLLIVAAVFMLLFGANKLPQMARSVGQSMRIFKAETRALSGDQQKKDQPPPAATAPPTVTESAQTESAQRESAQRDTTLAHPHEQPPPS